MKALGVRCRCMKALGVRCRCMKGTLVSECKWWWWWLIENATRLAGHTTWGGGGGGGPHRGPVRAVLICVLSKHPCWHVGVSGHNL